jgi:hypothetical protein
MKFKGTIIGEASGSYASNTFSHNRGGQYIRQRSIPVNSNTIQQQAVRNAMRTLSTRWNSTLTQAQRDAWNTYALNVLIADSLGEPRNVGGLGMYNRSNTPRIQAGKAIVDAAPTVFDLGTLTAPTIAANTPPTTISLAFTNTDAWATEVGGYLFVYVSRPQNPGIAYFKGPYRLATTINGAVSPPTSPVSVTAPFPFAAGNRVFLAARAARADGRLTSQVRLSFLA